MRRGGGELDVLAELVLAHAAVVAPTTGLAGLYGHPVARLEMVNLPSDVRHDADRFVAQYHRFFNHLFLMRKV